MESLNPVRIILMMSKGKINQILSFLYLSSLENWLELVEKDRINFLIEGEIVWGGEWGKEAFK